jgi:hypothetical protein
MQCNDHVIKSQTKLKYLGLSKDQNFTRFSMFRNTTPDSSDLRTLDLRPKYFLYISYIFVLDNMKFY